MSAQRLAYASDLTDEEWQILAPLLPPEKSGGRPRKYPMRDVIDGIQYVLRAGCAWRLIPHDLPHWQTAYQCFRAWRQDGTWLRIHDQLRAEPAGADASGDAAAGRDRVSQLDHLLTGQHAVALGLDPDAPPHGTLTTGTFLVKHPRAVRRRQTRPSFSSPPRLPPPERRG